MFARVGTAVVLIAACWGMAGCGSTTDGTAQSEGSKTTAAATTTAEENPDAVDLRPATFPTGEAVAFLLPETRAQMLCQALSPTEWKNLVQASIEYEVDEDGRCSVFNGKVAYGLELFEKPTHDQLPHTPIAGRPTTSSVSSSVAFVEPLLFDNLERLGYFHETWTPYLRISAVGASDEDAMAKAEQLANIVVPRLVRPGRPVPARDQFVATHRDPKIAITDEAGPTQAAILCTTALDIVGSAQPEMRWSNSGDNPYCGVEIAGSPGNRSKSWDFLLTTNRSVPDSSRPHGNVGELEGAGDGHFVTCLTDACPTQLAIEGRGNGPMSVEDFAKRVVSELLKR